MIIAFYMIVAFLIFIFFSYIYIKKLANHYINEELKILSGLNKKERLNDLPDNIKTEYNQTLEKIIKQENELNNSIDELKVYRNELDVTYSTLVSKSSQLEYTNSLLEKRVRDEAHRFGITYHRKLRSKRIISSELDRIEGIGEVRRKKLLTKFGSVTAIKKASIEELKEIVPEKVALEIKNHIK